MINIAIVDDDTDYLRIINEKLVDILDKINYDQYEIKMELSRNVQS